VRITGIASCSESLEAEYTVETVDFKDYAKHVLPNEWYASWPRESLRAGAMAVKMYGWYYVSIGGKWDDADVMDSTCDQVYRPEVAYASTNRAVDFTWPWRLTEADGRLFLTHYLDTYDRCVDYGWAGYCMGQWDTYYHATGNNGYEKLLWDAMLFRYYHDSELSYIPLLPRSGFMLRFYGNGWGDYDRLKVLIDDPQGGGLPADVGDSDFTLEWWMKAQLEDNTGGACASVEEGWTAGNLLFDRDLPGPGDHGEYAVSLAQGRIAFGVSNGSTGDTACGTTLVADGRWHHIAVTRSISDGLMRIYVDGALDAERAGPTGPLSYRDGRPMADPDQEPYLVVGARKGDEGAAFNGWIEDIRLSDNLRYAGSFTPPVEPLSADAHTVALYPLDEGHGNRVGDISGAAGGPSNGERIYGGDPENGPEWQVSDLFPLTVFYFPRITR
jgi:hypothetical protein